MTAAYDDDLANDEELAKPGMDAPASTGPATAERRTALGVVAMIEILDRLFHKLVIVERGWLIVAALVWLLSMSVAGYCGYAWGRR